jgi:hypothetical protein
MKCRPISVRLLILSSLLGLPSLLTGCNPPRTEVKKEVVITESPHGFQVPSQKEAVEPPTASQPSEPRVHAKAVAHHPIPARTERVARELPPSRHGWVPGLPEDGARAPAAGAANLCTAEEFPGEGPSRKFTEAEWTRFTTLFYGAKGDLIHWLKKHQGRLPAQTADALEARLRSVKLVQPTKISQADIPWRGTGVLTQDPAGNPLVELGPGFAQLMEKRPERARFEMMRLLAQSWSPCAIARKDVPQPWAGFLQCMKIDEAQACPVNSYSEGGWAVSTAVAQEVAPPGCRIPAFADAGAADCARKHLLPLTVVSAAKH